MANTSVKRKLGWKMRNKVEKVDTTCSTNRHELMEVPRHLQNSEPGIEPAYMGLSHLGSNEDK